MLPNARTAAPVEILLVEDNPGDAVLIGEAMKDNKLHNNLNLVRDGVEAMAFLKREGKYAQAIRPDLVILDLNLPRKSGREVLSEIKSDPLLKSIPVVVLTSSREERDVGARIRDREHRLQPVARFADVEDARVVERRGRA